MKRRPASPQKHSEKQPSSYDMQGGQSRDFHEENARNRELREHNQAEKKAADGTPQRRASSTKTG